MEIDGQDVRSEALEARKKRLARLLSRKAVDSPFVTTPAFLGAGLSARHGSS